MAIDFSLRWGQNQSTANKALVWSDAQVRKGWTGRIPRYQYDNNWLNDQCQKLFEIQRKGIPFWKNTDRITKYGLVRGSNGYYIAKKNSVGVNPATDTDYSHFCPVEVFRGVIGETIQVAVKSDAELQRFTKNGWKVMDGKNGTLDMQNRYIEGSPDMQTGGYRNTKSPKFKFEVSGTTSNNGAHTHVMYSGSTKLSISHLPPHTHYFTAYNWNDVGSGTNCRARIPWNYTLNESVLQRAWWTRPELDSFGNSSWTVRNGESDSNPFDNPNDPYLITQRSRDVRSAHKGNKRVWQTTSFTVRRDPSTQLNQNDFEYAKGSNSSHSHGSVTSTNAGGHTHTYTLKWEKTLTPNPRFVDVIFLQFIGF